MAMVIEKKCREVVDGIEYNVTYLRGDNCTSIVYDPVRTPEQKEKHDREVRAAIAKFGREMLKLNGEEWFRKHLQADPAYEGG